MTKTDRSRYISRHLSSGAISRIEDQIPENEKNALRFVKGNPGVDVIYVAIQLRLSEAEAATALFSLQRKRLVERRFPDEGDTRNKRSITGLVKFYPCQM